MKVGVYKTSSDGCRIIYDLLRRRGFKVEYVSRYDVEFNQLGRFEAVVFPGSYQHLFCWMESKDYRSALKRYVRSGGKFIGVCGGALLGIWLVDGFWRNALPNLRNGLYYGWYMLTGTFGRFIIRWNVGNRFCGKGEKLFCWAGGPALSESFQAEAVYAEDKWLLPFKDKTAIGFAKYGCGTVVLFGPHPEYLVGCIDNSCLLLKALKLF